MLPSQRKTPPELAQSAGSSEPGLGPRELYTAIRKNWLLVALCVCVVATSAVFYTMGKTRIYQASATVRVDPSAPKPLGSQVQSVVETGTGFFWANREYYETQFRILQSRRVAQATVRALGLNTNLEFLQNVPEGHPTEVDSASVEDAAEVLRSRVSIEPIRETRLVEVRLEDANPKRAQHILSTLVDIYIQQNIDDVLESTSTAADWLHDQLDKLKVELENNELKLHDYKMEKRILSVSISDQSNMLRDEMQQLNRQLTKVRADIQNIQARNRQLQDLSADNPDDLSAAEFLKNLLLSSLRQDYIKAKKDEESLIQSGKGIEHPEVKAAAARTRTARNAMVAEVKNIQYALSRELAAAQAEAAGLARLFADAKKRALDLNLLEIEYRRLERGKENTEKLYSLVMERTKESNLTRVMRFNNVRLIDAPLLPKTPVRPSVTMALVLGLFGGVVLGFVVAVGREFLDRSIKTPDDLERDLGLTFLGLLPSLDEQPSDPRQRGSRRRRSEKSGHSRPELTVHAYPKSGMAEAARAVRTNLMFMSPDRSLRRLLVTSAGPSEGKTTVASSVAIAMAQAGHNVLLVDGDLRRPRLHKVFGKTNEQGVSSALLDPSTVDYDALQTDIPNLSVLPCGPHAPNPAELLQSDSFSDLLQYLEKRYDRIVIDSPPLVPVTDATILSTKVDTTLLVVRAFKTSRELTRQAKRILTDVGAPLAGAVLNAVDLSRREYGYYQYYYYKKDGYAEKPAGEAT